MIRIALNLFMQLFAEVYPVEVASFLFEQYLMVSECDSESSESEVSKTWNNCFICESFVYFF